MLIQSNRRFDRLIVAVCIPSILLASCATAPPIRAEAADRHFQCESSDFSVEQRGTAAVVRFGDGSYRLERKPSSIGERFASDDATLIIDGDFAAFVAEDRLDLDGCQAAASIARARTPGN